MLRLSVLCCPIALLGCAQIGGIQKSQPSAFEGKFEFRSQGSASAIGELAKPASADERKVSLSFATSGSFRVDKFQSGYAVTLSQVDASYLDAGQRLEVFRSLQTWTIWIPPNSDVIQSNEELKGEKLLITRLFKSYWRASTTVPGNASEVELDGVNQVEYPTKGKRTWVSIQSQSANLAELPNRSNIPITAKVSGEIRYTGEPAPTLIEGTKRTQQFMGERQVGTSELSLKLSQTPAQPRPNKTTKYRYTYPLVEIASKPFGEKELQLKNLGKATLSTINTELAAPNLEVKDRNRLFLQLRALVYLNPEQCPKIVEQANLPAERMLAAEALTGISSKPAQAAYLKLLQKHEAADDYDSMLALLIPITKLEPELLNYLLRRAFKSNDIQAGYTAQLILGSNVRRCFESNPDQAKRLSDALESELRLNRSEDAKINLLYAMGNAGNPKLATYQIAYLGSPSARLRAAAVHSLRHLPPQFVKLTLDEFAPKETEPDVLKEIESIRSHLKEPS